MSIKTVGEYMSRYPFVVEAGSGIREALELMGNNDFRHLPVLEDGEIVGIVSDRDLKQAKGYDEAGNLLVKDVMNEDIYQVPVGTLLSEVVETLYQNKIGSALVLDRSGSVYGIFTTTDALRVLADILRDDEFGGRFKVIPIEEYFGASETVAV